MLFIKKPLTFTSSMVSRTLIIKSKVNMHLFLLYLHCSLASFFTPYHTHTQARTQRTHARTHTCMHTRTHTHTHARIYTRTHARIYTRTHTHVYTRAHTHTQQTHTHTQQTHTQTHTYTHNSYTVKNSVTASGTSPVCARVCVRACVCVCMCVCDEHGNNAIARTGVYIHSCTCKLCETSVRNKSPTLLYCKGHMD